MSIPASTSTLLFEKVVPAGSIPEAYSMVTPATPETSLKEIIRLPVSEWKERMVNDFERSVFPRHPGVPDPHLGRAGQAGIVNYLYLCRPVG
jgi:hypothetical protein